MPRGDGTGPDGSGPMTGRGAGKCSGNNPEKTENRSSGEGFFSSIKNRFSGKGSAGTGKGKNTGRGQGKGKNR